MANAASFSVKRGLNLDIWTTWPGQERWDEEDVLANFPEWRSASSPRHLAELKAAGFDFVRLPIDPSIFLQGWETPRVERLLAETLDTIGQLRAADLKVIVDLHLLPSTIRDVGTMQVMDNPDQFRRYLQLVSRMGEVLADQDAASVAFELMNEPVIDCGVSLLPKWPAMLKSLHEAARTAAPRLTLILSGGCWSSAGGLDAVNPAAIADDNIIWTFHSYEPFLLTHQGAEWTGDALGFASELPYPPERIGTEEFDRRLATIRQRIEKDAPEARRKELLKQFDNLASVLTPPSRLKQQREEAFGIVSRWAGRHGIAPERILLGEFGMIRQEYQKDFRVPSEWRAAYLKDMVTSAEHHGFAWAVWSWGGAFGITLEDSERKLDPVLLKGLGLKDP